LRDLNREEQYYKINFSDNGIGFDQKYVDKIFEIFQRHVRTENNGVGIGLSICRKIAQNHSGTITAQSEINKGSLFSFYIPVINGQNRLD
jgi:light-regulated signal transduction histidine kinase (bacteriophytochrome)